MTAKEIQAVEAKAQLIVTPIVPISVWEEMTGSLEFHNYRGRCIYCDMVHQELAGEKRIEPAIVASNPNVATNSESHCAGPSRSLVESSKTGSANIACAR